MPSRLVDICDIANFFDREHAGVHVDRDRDVEQFRRWRPAMVSGDEPFPFLNDFFHLPSPMPASGIVTLTGASVIADGLMLLGNELLVGEALMYPRVCFPYAHGSLVAGRHAAGGWSIDVPPERIHLDGTVANCICDGWQIYGHWLVDVLPRIERLLRSGKEIDTFLFAAPETEWQRALIKEIGLDIERCKFVDTSKLEVTCDTLVFATYDRFNSEIRPDLLNFYGRMLERHVNGTDIRRDRRLFISRVNWSGSRILSNREEVEAIAEAAGFEVVRPETLPFVEQMKLFASAEMLAGECGSGLHNSLFSPAATKVGVIQSNTNLNFLQAQIALWKDQEIYFCIGQETGENGRFEVNPADVRHMLHVMKG